MRQQTLASQASFERFGRKGKRELFLDQMEQVVPWSELLALVEPHYPKAGNGRQPVGLAIMLRTYFLQQWFNLSDPGMEEAFYDSPALCRFAGVDLGIAAAPDETTILRFRHERCPPWSGLLIASSGISFFSAGSRKVYRSWGRLQAPKTFGPKKPASAAEKPGDVQSSVRRPPHRDPSNLISPTPIVVVEIVTVKALWNHSEPQCSIRRPQRIQSKSLIFAQFQQISTGRRIWFGTRVSTSLKPCKIIYLQI